MLADALRDAAPPFLASDSGKEAGTGQRKQLGYFDRFRKKKCLQYATHMHEAKNSINLILSRFLHIVMFQARFWWWYTVVWLRHVITVRLTWWAECCSRHHTYTWTQRWHDRDNALNGDIRVRVYIIWLLRGTHRWHHKDAGCSYTFMTLRMTEVQRGEKNRIMRQKSVFSMTESTWIIFVDRSANSEYRIMLQTRGWAR